MRLAPRWPLAAPPPSWRIQGPPRARSLSAHQGFLHPWPRRGRRGCRPAASPILGRPAYKQFSDQNVTKFCLELPPLLVQRCTGTTAGLGYLEVYGICPCKSPHWTVDKNVRNVDIHWEEWLNSSADFNPNHKHVKAASKEASLQTTSRPHHHATPKQNYHCI